MTIENGEATNGIQYGFFSKRRKKKKKETRSLKSKIVQNISTQRKFMANILKFTPRSLLAIQFYD